MRVLHAIGAAALLMACAIPATSHADGPTTGASAPQPDCRCPGVQRHVWRPHRHVRGYAWHRRHWRPAPFAVALWPGYNPPIPSPYDSAYDRVHTQYMRAREWRGEYLIEPPYVPNPPLPGLPHFVAAAGGAVFEYDIIADGYVQLAQRDVPRALPVAVPIAPLPR
jgi:hypothetical protein